MKPERAFSAARPLARHCPELVGRGGGGADLAPQLARLGTRLARAYAAALARLTGGDAPRVQASLVRETTMAQLSGMAAPLAANSLLAMGSADAPMLASLEAEVVLRLLDRAFGGRGQAPAELPDAFPLSAELLIQRLEAVLGEALAQAFAETRTLAVQAIRRDGDLAALGAFAADQPLSLLMLDVEEAGGETWSLTLAFPPRTLAALLAERAPPPPRDPGMPQAANPGREPFADVPLTLSAVLVDMAIGFSRVADLRPGDVLPVAVARKVPLRVAGRTIAHGSAGAVDDRIAIQITQSF